MTVSPDVIHTQAIFESLSASDRAEWLRYALQQSGVSRVDVRRVLGVQGSTISSWANTGIGLHWVQWVALCTALRIPLTWKMPDGAHAKKLPRGRPKAEAH